jgi:hypothetical protein
LSSFLLRKIFPSSSFLPVSVFQLAWDFLLFSDQVLLIFHFGFFLVTWSREGPRHAARSQHQAGARKQASKQEASKQDADQAKQLSLQVSGVICNTLAQAHACMPISNTAAACWRRLIVLIYTTQQRRIDCGFADHACAKALPVLSASVVDFTIAV